MPLTLFQTREERRISISSGLILVLLVAAAGALVYGLMRHETERMISRTLEVSLQAQVGVVERELRAHAASVALVATRPFLQEQLLRLNNDSRDTAARAALGRGMRSFYGTGFSALMLLDAQGRIIAHFGEEIGMAELSVPVELSYPSRLEWRSGFVVVTEVGVFRDGMRLGTVIGSRRLPELLRQLARFNTLGETGEIALCGPVDAQSMQCFPTRHRPAVMPRLPRMMQGEPLPMDRALAGERGFTLAKDYRGQQVGAAYAPVANLGLGMVLKLDADELFRPVHEQAWYVVPALLLLVLLGGFLLRWQVMPLIRRVVASQQEALDANRKLQKSEARTRAVLDNVAEGIVSIKPDGTIQTFNPAAERMFGYRAEEVIGQNVGLLMPEPYRSEHPRYLARYLASGRSPFVGSSRELAGQRKDGSIFPLDLRLGQVEMEGERLLIGAIRDISERKEAEARVIQLANHDGLTELPNRTLLLDRGRQALTRAAREQTRVGVMFLDLDHFKTINDSLGHFVGDRLLQTVAARIRTCLREEDTVARQGGDEFIVVTPAVKRFEDLGIVAQKLLNALSAPYNIEGAELHTSCSIGVSVYPEDGQDMETLMRNADISMYYAKATGRNNFQFFTPQMNKTASERLQLETRLRQALQRGEFELHYQPIVSLASGIMTSAEALLRWNTDGGPVGPARFIPIAEETGLILPIGEWVLRTACRAGHAWQACHPSIPRVIVNLSARQFAQKNLGAIIGRILQETAFPAERFGIEITESLLMDRPDDAIRTLTLLADMGVQISVDDFGTGYSSLSYLKRFPLDKLKIDRSFVRDIVDDADDAAIVDGIIALAHRLGIRVVAEGVESEMQLQFLRERGCDECQGYYFSRPVPGDDMLKAVGRPLPGAVAAG